MPTPDMSPTPHASTQEALVHAFSERSMSSTMLFPPDEYRKGNATREPCDLVWIARDMLILMAMQESNKPQETQDAHNLKQLRGWLRIWSSTELLLSGRTPLETVTFDYNDYPLVLMSVTEAAEGRASIMPLEGGAKNLGEEQVILACSLPAKALIRLAETGGGAADLAALVKRLARVGGTVSADIFTAWVDDARDAAYAQVIERYKIPHHLREKFIGTYPHLALLSMRHNVASEKNPEAKNKVHLLGTTFNDIEWYGLFQTVWKMTTFAESILEAKPDSYGITVVGDSSRTGNYTIFTGAYDSGFEGAAEKLIGSMAAVEPKDGYPVLSITDMIFARLSDNPIRTLMVAGEPPTGRTRTRQLYEEAASLIQSPKSDESQHA